MITSTGILGTCQRFGGELAGEQADPDALKRRKRRELSPSENAQEACSQARGEPTKIKPSCPA